MARPKRQDKRRASLIAAAQRAIIKHGPDGAILNRIAEEANVAPQTVTYYFPEVAGLLLDAVRVAMERFHTARVETIEQFNGSADQQLRLMISLGLPTTAEDPEVRVLSEMGGAGARFPIIAALLTTLFDREVSTYRTVLERGVAEGLFTMQRPVEEVARNLVSLEDAYGYRLIAHHPTISPQAAFELILGYASLATGHPLNVGAHGPQIR